MTKPPRSRSARSTSSATTASSGAGTPPAAPAGSPPSGAVASVAPCCPDVSTFEGSTGSRRSYFGFDDKTNNVASPGSGEYWIPPTAAKTLGFKEFRDGARWVSVGVGLEAQVEINFDGTFTAACLLNCTFEVDPSNVASVTTPVIAGDGVAFKIKGLAAGEASLKVICDGQLRGYFHIWCVQAAVIRLDVVNLISAKSTGGGYSIPSLQAELTAVFGQAVIAFDIVDLGDVNMTSNGAFTTIESTFYDATGAFVSNAATLTAIELAAKGVIAGRALVTDPAMRAAMANTKVLRPNSLTLYYYVPPLVANSVVGSVITVGQSPAFTFTRDPTMADNTGAHELGHALDLVHPSDTSANTVQYPAHHLGTLGAATSAMPATNTEPAVAAGQSDGNVLAADPLNVMGYWANFQEAKPMRYRQWKACRRTA